MACLRLTSNLARHLDASELSVSGSTLAAILDDACRQRPQLRSYVLTDQGELRKHVSIFIDGHQARDRRQLADQVGPDSFVDIIQALSGG